MAPLPTNNTAVLFVDYTTGGAAHTVQLRVPASQGVNVGLGVMAAFLMALQGVLPNAWAVTGTRYRAQNSNLTLPVAPGALDGFVGTGGAQVVRANEALEFVWVGRSPSTGRRWELSLYGIRLSAPDDFRYSTSNMPPSLATATDTLISASAAAEIVSIDGDEPIVYPYVNVNYNSYWESRLRRNG